MFSGNHWLGVIISGYMMQNLPGAELKLVNLVFDGLVLRTSFDLNFVRGFLPFFGLEPNEMPHHTFHMS